MKKLKLKIESINILDDSAQGKVVGAEQPSPSVSAVDPKCHCYVTFPPTCKASCCFSCCV